jgi:adenylylsulfate kinase
VQPAFFPIVDNYQLTLAGQIFIDIRNMSTPTKIKKIDKPWTIWITGLSGSGKTTISKQLMKILDKHNNQYEYLRLDEIRQFLTPNPTFSEQEREFMYRASIYMADLLNKKGFNSIIDSVDGEGTGRRLGKERIPGFKVIRIDCPLEECMAREHSRTDKAAIVDIYAKAKQGQLQLAGMGRDYAFEENPLIAIDSTKHSAEESAQIIAKYLI